MLILGWFLLTVAIFTAIDIFSFSIKRKGWDRFICTFLLGYAQIILTQFVLGISSLVYPTYLVLINVIVSVTVLALLRKKNGTKLFINYWRSVRKTVSQTAALIKSDVLWLVLLIVAALLLLWIVFLGIIFPAVDFDGNSYHLTFIANVIQNHNIFDMPTSLSWLNGYPKGGEFIDMWNVLIPYNDMFADLGQVPFLILGIYALYAIAKRVGVDERHARFVSVLYIFLPIVLNQLKTTYVDVMLCSLFFAAIAIVIKKKLSKLDLALLGIIYSLLISMKFTGFLFVATTVPLLFWSLYANRQKKKKKVVANYVLPLTVVFIPTLFGFYWYIKNAVLYGNPLYPFGVKLAGITILPGKTFQEFAASAVSSLKDLPSGYIDRIWFVWTEQKDWFGCLYNYDANFSGFGPIWFVVMIPAILVSIYIVIKQRNYLYMWIFAIVAVVFAAYPANYYSRYTLFISALGIISLGIVFTNIKPVASNIVKIGTIALAASVIFMNLALCNFPPGAIKVQLKNGLDYHGTGSAYANTFGLVAAHLRDVVRPGDIVAYDSSPYFIYPLWNKDYSNKVIYIPATNEKEWMTKAAEQKVKYTFTLIGSKENKWLKNSDNAKSIYKDKQNEIFKLR